MNVILILSIVFGLIACFSGYKIFKSLLGLSGFLAGGVLAASYCDSLYHQSAITIVSGLVAGLICGGLVMAVYHIGIFISGAFGGIILACYFSSNHPETSTLLILAIICGVLALAFEKFMLIALTGFGGALCAVTGAASLLGMSQTAGTLDLATAEQLAYSTTRQTVWMVLWIVLGIAGMRSQYRQEAPESPKAKPETPKEN